MLAFPLGLPVLGLPLEVVAAPSQDALEIRRQARNTVSEAQALRASAVGSDPQHSDRVAKDAATLLRRAGELYADAAKAQPEGPDTRGVRRDLLDQAVSVFMEAYQTWPADPAPLERAKIRVNRYIQGLVKHYGQEEAESLAEYTAAQDHVRALDRALAVHRPVTREPDVAPPSPPPEPPRPKPPEPPRPQPPIGPESGPTTVRHSDQAIDRRTHSLGVALGISAGLLGASVAWATGAGVQIAREPFKGRLYKEIERASIANGLPHSENDDMCEGAGRDVAAVVDACDRRDRVAGVAVAMTVLSGAFAVSTGVLAALLVRAGGTRAHRLRRHAAGVIVAPQRGGAVLTLGARF